MATTLLAAAPFQNLIAAVIVAASILGAALILTPPTVQARRTAVAHLYPAERVDSIYTVCAAANIGGRGR